MGSGVSSVVRSFTTSLVTTVCTVVAAVIGFAGILTAISPRLCCLSALDSLCFYLGFGFYSFFISAGAMLSQEGVSKVISDLLRMSSVRIGSSDLLMSAIT